ncbi:hypothetical protein FACS189459_5090 [Bacilli bacterium]|nr:hypothetical protein FACS189459_5090 [Bacilli bacterium]
MSENKLGGFDKVHENFEKNKEEFDAKEEKNAKIDFSKFSRTKGNKTGSKKFSSKLEVFLNKKKFLIID